MRRCRTMFAAVPPLLAAAAVLCLLAARQAAPDRFLRPGEPLRISVVGLFGEGVETRLLRRVAADGTIRLPLIGTDDLDATGMTADDLERDLTRRYERQTTAKRPAVIVSRLESGEDHQADAAGEPSAAANAAGPVRMTMLSGELPTPPPAAFDRPNGAAINFDAVPLREAVDRLRETSGLSIWVNYQALELQGVDGNTEVTLRLAPGVTLRKTTRLLLDQVGGGFAELDWTWDEGVLTISTAEDLRREVVVALFDVRPLLDRARAEAAAEAGESDFSKEEFLEYVRNLILDTVEAGFWQDNGGSVGKIADNNGRFVITATPDMIRGVASLLDKLRGG